MSLKNLDFVLSWIFADNSNSKPTRRRVFVSPGSQSKILGLDNFAIINKILSHKSIVVVVVICNSTLSVQKLSYNKKSSLYKIWCFLACLVRKIQKFYTKTTSHKSVKSPFRGLPIFKRIKKMFWGFSVNSWRPLNCLHLFLFILSYFWCRKGWLICNSPDFYIYI